MPWGAQSRRFFSPMAKAGFEMKPGTPLNEVVENDLAVST
jgi:hypothetical protein